MEYYAVRYNTFKFCRDIERVKIFSKWIFCTHNFFLPLGHNKRGREEYPIITKERTGLASAPYESFFRGRNILEFRISSAAYIDPSEAILR